MADTAPLPTFTVEPVPADALLGAVVENYVVEQKLSEGGMGRVYVARHKAIGLRGALKILKVEASADPEWASRFITEARALASLDNPNIVKVLNFGNFADGQQYLLMEFLEGESLERELAQRKESGGPMSAAEALKIADQVLNGLAEAHKKGVVHRDLKPGNIFLSRTHSGEKLVKLLDFGLARQKPMAFTDIKDSLRIDKASIIAGTPEYIAPEQALGLNAEGTADLYSLGVTLYEMLTLEPPFRGATVVDLMKKHVSEPAPRVSSLVSNLPDGIDELVDSLLAKAPKDRPPTADVARAQVQRLLKRIQSDSTAVRPMPTAPEGPNQRQLVTMKVDKAGEPSLSSATDKAIARALQPRPKWPVVVGALIALLVLLLGWKLVSSSETPAVTVRAGKPPEAVTQVFGAEHASEPPPLVVPAPAVKAVEPVALEPELPALPVAPTAKPPREPRVKAQPRLVISAAECVVSDKWRAQLTTHLMDVQSEAARDATLYKEFQDAEGELAKQISTAVTGDDCAKAQNGVHDLAVKFGEHP